MNARNSRYFLAKSRHFAQLKLKRYSSVYKEKLPPRQLLNKVHSDLPLLKTSRMDNYLKIKTFIIKEQCSFKNNMEEITKLGSGVSGNPVLKCC